MARNLKGETEFGLPSPMPVLGPDGKVATGSAIAAAVAAGGLPLLTDATAVAEGAVGQNASTVTEQQMGHELRAVYAKGEGSLGPGRVGNSELKP